MYPGEFAVAPTHFQVKRQERAFSKKKEKVAGLVWKAFAVLDIRQQRARCHLAPPPTAEGGKSQEPRAGR